MLSELFALGLDEAALAAYAARLGSDCAFFVYNRPMIGTGRGEILEPCDIDLSQYELRVDVPAGVSVSTADAYRGIVPREAAAAGRACPLREALSRPVALFVAFVSLVVVEMGPSVVEQYPDNLETDAVDRIGLSIVRAVQTCAKPPSALSPLSKLASDDCVEAKDALETFAADFLLAPLVLSLLSALAMRRKT